MAIFRNCESPNSQYRNTLLGRLHLQWMASKTADEGPLPDNASLNRELLAAHRANPASGKMLIHFMGCKSTTIRQLSELEFGFDTQTLLQQLEDEPWTEARFLEIQNSADPTYESEGVLIYQEQMRDTGRVYVITIFSESSFPLVRHMEIRACRESPEPFIGLQTASGYIALSKENVFGSWDETEPSVKIAILGLQCLHGEKMHGTASLSDAASIENMDAEFFPPPPDERCDRLLQEVADGKIFCTKIPALPIEAIKPANYNHSMFYPAGLIKSVMLEINVGQRPTLLLYWDGSSFVMSDDYAAYSRIPRLIAENDTCCGDGGIS
jgi:hypothetical protein